MHESIQWGTSLYDHIIMICCIIVWYAVWYSVQPMIFDIYFICVPITLPSAYWPLTTDHWPLTTNHCIFMNHGVGIGKHLTCSDQPAVVHVQWNLMAWSDNHALEHVPPPPNNNALSLPLSHTHTLLPNPPSHPPIRTQMLGCPMPHLVQQTRRDGFSASSGEDSKLLSSGLFNEGKGKNCCWLRYDTLARWKNTIIWWCEKPGKEKMIYCSWGEKEILLFPFRFAVWSVMTFYSWSAGFLNFGLSYSVIPFPMIIWYEKKTCLVWLCAFSLPTWDIIIGFGPLPLLSHMVIHKNGGAMRCPNDFLSFTHSNLFFSKFLDMMLFKLYYLPNPARCAGL